jgi:hypothetical protein
MDRDFDKDPYRPDEERVCKYLQEKFDHQIGCGDDPIGFLIASHDYLTIGLQELLVTAEEKEKE